MRKNLTVTFMVVLFVFVSIFAFASDGFDIDTSFYNESFNGYEEKVYLPVLNDNSFPISKTINARIKEDILDMRNDTQNLAIQFNDYEGCNNYYFSSNYRYSMNGDLVSLLVDVYYNTGGAHGNTYLCSYTGNIGGKEIFSIGDLFKDSVDYDTLIKNAIKEIVSYDPYYEGFDDIMESVYKSDISKFYIDESGNIVIYFNPYEVGPYAFGIIEFKIPAENFKDALKTDIYSYITKNTVDKSNLRINGKMYNTENQILFNSDKVLIPLKEITDLMGIKLEKSGDSNYIINGQKLSYTHILNEDYINLDDFFYIKGIEGVYNINDKSISIYIIEK